MSDLVGNPEDWFSHNEAHMTFKDLKCLVVQVIFYPTQAIQVFSVVVHVAFEIKGQ